MKGGTVVSRLAALGIETSQPPGKRFCRTRTKLAISVLPITALLPKVGNSTVTGNTWVSALPEVAPAEHSAEPLARQDHM